MLCEPRKPSGGAAGISSKTLVVWDESVPRGTGGALVVTTPVLGRCTARVCVHVRPGKRSHSAVCSHIHPCLFYAALSHGGLRFPAPLCSGFLVGLANGKKWGKTQGGKREEVRVFLPYSLCWTASPAGAGSLPQHQFPLIDHACGFCQVVPASGLYFYHRLLLSSQLEMGLHSGACPFVPLPLLREALSLVAGGSPLRTQSQT